MNTFKRKALSCAILGGLAAASGAAQAVYEDPNGLGQALIYPYYTVQTAGGNSYNTYLSVVNTTTRAKALKVRFREGKNSREVLDFNLYLSPNDVWTAAVGPADATATSGAVLFTGDKSCTAPAIPAGGIAFRNFSYVSPADAGPTTLDRTREGYFEIIEMANLTGAAASAVTHGASGTPANCAFVQPENGFTAATNAAFLQAPSGGITGTYTLINVANGLNFGGNATALAQFSSAPIYTDIGNEFTNLTSANPPVAVTVSNNQTGASGPGTTTYVATYASGRDAVSATMMHSSVINEFALDVATKSATDWVLTFPTKQFYLAPNVAGAPQAPFSQNFVSTGSCEPINFTFFNREEQGAAASGSNFSPLPPGPAGAALCWEAQVLSMGSTASATSSSVFGSQNYLGVTVNAFQNGWARIDFTGVPAAGTGLSSIAGTGTVTNVNTGTTLAAQTVNYRGLPVIGFMARTLNNGALSCTTFGGSAGTCAGSYGAAFDHKYLVTVTPTP